MEGLNEYVRKYGHYLEDIRKRAYRIVIVFVVVFIAGFFLANGFIKFLISFLRIKDVVIVATSPFQLINLSMDIGFFIAVLVTLPLCVQQIYSFLRSGLLPKERRIFLKLIPAVVLLFLFGFFYGIVVMYLALQFIAAVNVSLGVANLWNVTQFVSQIIVTATLLGVLFEFPIVLTFLIRIGLLNVNFLVAKRRHAVVVILILVALLAPVDAVTFLVMCAPLLVLYETTIRLNGGGTRHRRSHY